MSAKRTRKVDLSFFEKIDTEEKAYFLGLMYADGYNNVKGGYFIVSLNYCDKDILLKFKKALKSGAKIVRRIYKRTDGYEKVRDSANLQINSRKMTKDLERHGCMQAKTHLITFPFWLKENLWSHFIRGYFDGDGGLSSYKVKSKNSIVFRANIVSNPRFVKDLNDVFLKKIGRRYYVLKYHKHKSTQQIRIECGNPNVETFLNWLYKDATVYLDRKHLIYQSLLKRVNQWNRPIKVFNKITGNLIGHYPSVKSASIAIGADLRSVHGHINGEHVSKKFRYEDCPLPIKSY